MPRLRASRSASLTEWSDENRDGISTPCTCSAPRASAAMVATMEESMPPDRPMTTSVKPFLLDVVARADDQSGVDLVQQGQRFGPDGTSEVERGRGRGRGPRRR